MRRFGRFTSGQKHFERFWRHQLSRVKERAEGKNNPSNHSTPNFIPGRKNDFDSNKN